MRAADRQADCEVLFLCSVGREQQSAPSLSPLHALHVILVLLSGRQGLAR